MHDIEYTHRFLPNLVRDPEKNDIVIYRNTQRPVRPKKTRLPAPVPESVKNTLKQCLIYHKEGRHLPNISSFPSIPPPPKPSTFEALTSLHGHVKTLFRQYEKIASQTADVREAKFLLARRV